MKALNKTLIIYFVLTITPCKKARTCTCDIVQTLNTNVSYNNGSANTSSITTSGYQDIKSNNYITKGDAYQTFDCHDRNEKYTDVNTVYSGTLTTTTTLDHSDDYKCVLK